MASQDYFNATLKPFTLLDWFSQKYRSMFGMASRHEEEDHLTDSKAKHRR